MELRLPDGRVAVVRAGAEEFILDAARAAGLDLPSLCEQGWCTTCACRIVTGEVDQSASRRFYDADREAGFALICTGQPRSDLVLLTHQHPAMREHRIARRLPVPRGISVDGRRSR